MSRVWFAEPLETVATYWQVLRRDGVALGFTSHDADLWFDGLLHRAAPGMTPAAIRRSADIEPDSAEVRGALAHDALSAADLAAGRFDGALIRIGLVDWQTGEREPLYRGTIGGVVRGILPSGTPVHRGMKSGDVDPRCQPEYCTTASDKALAVGGGALEAILHLTGALR